ncbi:MAG: hypothetical protein HXY40_09475 [Chloroflexi bacterium]|nr:hypothetical protein [Chloroflexota bacterium]
MDEQARTPTTPSSGESAPPPAAATPPTPPTTMPEVPPVDAAAAAPVASDEASMSERLERLGGEPAPVITPEEFARLQRQGQVHIDERGRVKTTRRSGAEAGVSLRKRRAWYAV